MIHNKPRSLGYFAGLPLLIALAGFCFIRAEALSIPDGAVTITLKAPSFESNPDGGLRLLLPEEMPDTAGGGRTPVYSTDVEEGQPVLPHRLVTLILPPDADLNSLELEVEGAQVELAPGKFQVPLAEPKVPACAPVAAAKVCASPVTVRPVFLMSPLIMGQPLPFHMPALSLQQSTDISAQPVTLMPYGQLRKWKLARLDYQPFRYDPSSGELTVTRQVTARVTFRRDPALLDRTLLSDTVMDEMAPQAADNYAEAKPWYESALASLGGPIRSAVINDYLIITTDDIYNNSNITIYAQFLREHGHTVTIFKTSRYGATGGQPLAAAIRAELKQLYPTMALNYVLLVGDPTPDGFGVPMTLLYPDHLTNIHPTEHNPRQVIPTDLYYADLNGDWDLNDDGYAGEAANPDLGWAGDFGPGGVDFSPSVYVGRIPVYNNNYATLNAILQKLMDYQSVVNRPVWRDNALLAATFGMPGFDGAMIGHRIEEDLLSPAGVSAYRIYSNYPNPHTAACSYDQTSGYPHEADLDEVVVQNYWSANPVGLVVWSAHGNIGVVSNGFGDEVIDCWHGYMLTNGQVAALDDSRPAFTYQDSCLNGYPEDPYNLGYQLLKNGAVATVSAARVSFFGGETEATIPTDYASAATKGYKYVSYLMQGASAGSALEWAASLFPVAANTNAQNNFDFNLYGDPALEFYIPPAATLEAPSNLTGELTEAGGIFSFHLDWQDNSTHETFFRINLVPTDNSGSTIRYVERNRITANVPTPPACGKTYYVSVQAGNGSVLSPLSYILTLAAQPCPPPSPAASLVGFIGDYHVKLVWSDVSGETGYNIYRRVMIGNTPGTLAKVGSVGANVTTFTDSTSICAKTYIYNLVAYNSGGSSSSEPGLNIASQMCVPPAPSDLTAGVVTQTGLTLKWADNSSGGTQGEDGFGVYRQPPGGSWTRLAALAADTTSYSVEGLQCSEANSNYKVDAYNNGGRAESAVISAGPAACTLPAAPTDLKVDDADLYPGSVQLGWADNSDNEWGFKIEKLNGKTWELVATAGVDESGKQITGLSCSTTFSFQVYAYNRAGNSGVSATTASTAACDPYVPTNFQGSAGKDGISLTWEWGEWAIRSFEIQRSLASGRVFTWTTIATPAASARSYLDGLDPVRACGNSYYYRIRGLPLTGTFPYAYTPAMLVHHLPCPPASPGALSAQIASSSSILLSWKLQLLRGVPLDGFNIYRSPHGASVSWSKIGSTAADELTFTDTGLSCGQNYDYKVAAFNAGGEGSSSAVLTAGTPECPPAAPSGLTRIGSSLTSLTFSWTDNSADEDGFILQRFDTVNGWTDVATTAAGGKSASEEGLTCGMLYRYRVLAFNSGGESAPSPELETATQLCQPVASAIAGTQGVVTLTWQDLTTFPVEHLVERQSVAGGPWASLGSAKPGQATFRDLAAPCGVTLYYHVAGTSAISGGPWSNPAGVATTCAPTTTITLSAGSTTPHTITLTWTTSAGGQTGLELERSYDGKLFWETIGTFDAGATEFMDTDLPPGSRFFYRLHALNAGGQVSSSVAYGQTKFELQLPLVIR